MGGAGMGSVDWTPRLFTRGPAQGSDAAGRPLPCIHGGHLMLYGATTAHRPAASLPWAGQCQEQPSSRAHSSPMPAPTAQ
jgi:hypothetical protein